jgi:hypothetical protein
MNGVVKGVVFRGEGVRVQAPVLILAVRVKARAFIFTGATFRLPRGNISEATNSY